MGVHEVGTGTVTVKMFLMKALRKKEVGEHDTWNVLRVFEGPLWASVRAFLVPDDVLCMRTTAEKWNAAGLYGPFAELYFVLLKKDVKNGPLPNSERPRA